MSNINMKICSKCACNNKVEIFNSKLKGSSIENGKNLCDNCYEFQEKQELDFIKMGFRKGLSINDLVDIKYIDDFVNPNSRYCIFNPIQKYRIIEDKETKTKYIQLDFDEYMKFLKLMALSNTKLHNEDWLNKQKARQEKHDAVESRKISALERKEIIWNDKEKQAEEKVQQEIRQREYEREKTQKQIEEHQKEWKKVYKQNKDFKPFKCRFCDEYKVYPYHFKDDNDKTTLLTYKKQGKCQKALSCSDCYYTQKEKEQIKKENDIITFSEYCDICECNFIARNDFEYDNHCESKKHKRKENKLKGIIDLNLFTKKELENICSKTLNENGTTYLISNYTKIKKDELIEKMNAVKDKLVIEYD